MPRKLDLDFVINIVKSRKSDLDFVINIVKSRKTDLDFVINIFNPESRIWIFSLFYPTMKSIIHKFFC